MAVNLMMEGRAALYEIVLNTLQVAEEQELQPQRQLYMPIDPFDINDGKFVKLFRLNKELVLQLIDRVTIYLRAPSRKSALSIASKVLVTLRFYATGSYQEITGSNIFTAISQPSVSRCITEVTNALNQPTILNDWIKFPQNIQDMENLRRRFYEKYQFPGVIGLVDCTHVAIAAPKGEEYPEHIYVNRKHYHSINVQLICDENLRIMHVDARFPGSCNDMHIWKQTSVAPILESIYRRHPSNLFYLLGDSGYTLRPWLMTPLDSPPTTAAEELFDIRLKTVRSGIERCNGVLKNRFRCLLKHRVLHYRPDRAAKITNACVVLHNMCLNAHIPDPEADNSIEELDFGMNIDDVHTNLEQNNGPSDERRLVNPDLATARILQRQIAVTHFND